MDKILNNILKTNWRIFFVISLLALLAYAVILPTPFKTMDDYFSIVQNDKIKDFAHLKEIFATSFFGGAEYYRPLVYSSFMVEYQLFHLNAFYYNLDNLLLHVLSSCLVFLILTRLTKDRILSLLATLLFVIHPVHWEAVANVPGRSILLCAFFLLLSFYLFIRCLDNQKTQGLFLIFAVTSFVFSLLSKESAVVLPLILVSYVYFQKQEFPEKFRAIQTKVWPFFIVLFFYIVLRKLLGITAAFAWPGLMNSLLGFLTFLKALLEYAQVIIFPIDLYYDHSTLIYVNFHNVQLWLVVFFWMAVGWMMFKRRKQLSRQTYFWLSWIVIQLLPVAQIVPLRTSYDRISSADHFLYLPSIGILVILVHAVKKACKWLMDRELARVAVIRGLMISMFVFLFLTTIQQNIYARQEIAMFQRSLEHNSQNARVLNSLAVAYARVGLFHDAEKYFRKSLELNPMDAKARIGLGVSLCDQGRYWDGIKEYDKVVDPGALDKLLKGNSDLAYGTLIKKFKERIVTERENPRLYYSLGIMYAKTEEFPQAIKYFNKAIELKPDYKNALFNLAYAYDSLHQKNETIEFLEQVLKIDGKKDEINAMALRRLADLYKGFGQEQKIQEYLKEAKAIEEAIDDDQIPVSPDK